MNDETLLRELLSTWEQGLVEGRDPPAFELCPDRPELAIELSRRIQEVRRLKQCAQTSKAGVVPTPFEQVVSVCDNFTVDWKPGTEWIIDSYLGRVDAEAQPTLLRNLLAIDIKRRREAGEQPHVEDYLQRFPQFASLIRTAFLELSSVSSVVSHESLKPKVAPMKVLAATRLGEYRLLGELGHGGMGVVYEAVHLQRGNPVALKTLPTVNGAALHRFKREFRALAGINHPNLIGLHTLEVDGSQWFFTMDLIEGEDFLSFVRPRGVLDPARLRSALTQLVVGVLALHGHHIVHCDLKPPNVMVTQDGRIILLDFGLVLELERANITRTSDGIAGTPGYMAPEQAAGLPVSAAGDWYAVGVMLYEALAGSRPFNGSLWEMLQAKQARDAPPLPEGTAIPADLAALCMRLLARDPQQRPDALEIAKLLSASLEITSAAAPVPGGHGLVGRDPHLATLKDAYRALDREPQTVFISGRSGEGKTALAEHFLASLGEDKSLAIMAGRCYDRESVPFKALDSLIDALASYLRALPETEAALLMPDDIGVLARVFPVLQRVEVVARAGTARIASLDEQQIRQRAFGALRSLLGRMSRRSPIIWFIDDLQWGDADSAGALFEVLKPPEAPQVLFLGTYRSDETEGSAFLKMWKDLQRKHDVRFAEREVKVSPLTVQECTELVIDLVGKDDDGIRRRAADFARETRGNPFLLIELVGCFDPDSDSFEPIPLHEMLARKLGRLPDEAAHLLEVVAVSGQALSLEEASRTAGHALPPVATITRMRNERLVRLVGAEESPLVDTYHDRVREAVLGGMEDATCRTIHRTLADVIEQDVGGATAERVAALESAATCPEGEEKAIPRVYDLAYHYDAAGERRKAWIYALLAAEQARRQSALEVAVNNYALAKRSAEETNHAVRYRIAEGYGASLMLLGRYEESKEQLEGVIDLVEDPEKKGRIEVLQGEIAFKQGALDRSNAYFDQGLRRLGNWVPRTRLGLGFGILRESVIQCVHSLWPRRLHREPHSSRLDLTISIFNRTFATYCFQNTVKMLWAHLSGMNRAELLPRSKNLAFSYTIHGMMMSMLGWHSRGSRYGDRSLEIVREFDDLWGYGNSCNYSGIGLHASARYEESLARLTEAIDAFAKAGDLWEVHLAHFHIGCCHYGLGDLAEAVAEARWTFASSARIGDSRTFCSTYLWARAMRGDIPFEELRSCYPCRPDDVMSTVHGIMAEGHWHTHHGRTAEALQTFELAAELVRKSLCVNSHMIVVLPELAGALRRHADAIQVRDARQAERLRRRAHRLAKWAVRITRLFPAVYPLALRELSLILAARGKTRKALKVADKSIAVAESQKAKYEHAQSLLVRGTLAKDLSLPEAAGQLSTARAALDALEKPVHEAVEATVRAMRNG